MHQIIRIAGIIREKVLLEEIRKLLKIDLHILHLQYDCRLGTGWTVNDDVFWWMIPRHNSIDIFRIMPWNHAPKTQHH